MNNPAPKQLTSLILGAAGGQMTLQRRLEIAGSHFSIHLFQLVFNVGIEIFIRKL